MKPLPQTDKNKIRQGRKRAVFDREALYQILDEARVVHVGFSTDEQTYVIPMLGWRVNNTLYIHGSNSSRMIKALTTGINCCVTATIVDGMVLSKSAFHHSTNYRSAVVFGAFRTVSDPAEINESLQLFVESITPGRWQDVRPPSANELKATSILAIELEEVSVKIRTGGPNEDKKDLDIPVWSGEMVMKQSVVELVPDEHCAADTPEPDYSEAWKERWDLS